MTSDPKPYQPTKLELRAACNLFDWIADWKRRKRERAKELRQ